MKKITMGVLTWFITMAIGAAPAMARKVEVNKKSPMKMSFTEILGHNNDADVDDSTGIATKVAATCLGLTFNITTKTFSCMELACNDGVRPYLATDTTTGVSKEISCDVDCPAGEKPDANGTCDCRILTAAESSDSDPECHE